MDLFESCRDISELINSGEEQAARDGVIQLLDTLQRNRVPYTPLVNHLIREVGLFPYLEPSTTAWFDRFVSEAFKADVGEATPVTLHREQSRLLSSLLAGKSIAVSAPTSFGKSFVIDAFIAATEPNTVVIIVPTIALTDETRRRLERRFGRRYKIVTAGNQSLAPKSILVLPQERAQGYINDLGAIDLLVIDEFYKASKSFDKDRAPALIHVMQRLSKKSKQRYYLAPNIDSLRDSPLTFGMEFLPLDFNTVFLDKKELFRDIRKDEGKKSAALLSILEQNEGKTLIYAGTYSNVTSVSTLMLDARKQLRRPLLTSFATWLGRHYDPNWTLPRLIVRGTGIHTGQLHRSLSQIQVRLFEEPKGLDQLISTSSIIEGVNTSAENVVVWSNKSGRARINNFTYRNIIGRSGRMFRHFVGKVFILEEPPAEQETSLSLDYPDELLGVTDHDWLDREYTPEQVAKIKEYEEEMSSLVGAMNLRALQQGASLLTNDSELILKIARSVTAERDKWSKLRNLNSEDPMHWESSLYNVLKLASGSWDGPWGHFVHFVQVISRNWDRTIPELLYELDVDDIGIGEFFKLERTMTFRLATIVSDISTLFNATYTDTPIDLSHAVSRFAHAFLPTVVFQLEEYGLPRMLARKIHTSGIVNFEDQNLDLDAAMKRFRELGLEALYGKIADAEGFDRYLLEHFYEGIGAV